MDTQTKVNPFASAVKKETAAKKDNTKVINDAEIAAQVEQFATVKNKIKNDEAEAKILEGIVKDRAKILFLQAYQKEGRNPGSFKLAGTTKTVSVSIQDRYKSIDADTAATLQSAYGEDVVECKNEYTFNSEVLEKHYNQIAQALSNLDIPDDDLAILLEMKVKYSVAPGTIDKLLTKGASDPAAMFNSIEPICMIRC